MNEKPSERSRLKWESSTKLDINGRVLEGMDRIYLIQDRNRCRASVNTVLKHWAPYTA